MIYKDLLASGSLVHHSTGLSEFTITVHGHPKELKGFIAIVENSQEIYEDLERHCALCMLQHPDCEGCELCPTYKILQKLGKWELI